jgi:hypothetical protein
VPTLIGNVSEDASTESEEELEATDPRFDNVKIITRSGQGKLITKPVNVSPTTYTFKLYSISDKIVGNRLLIKIRDHSLRTWGLCSRPGHSLNERICFYILIIAFC